jgi:ABC-type branched-subunit amino acid transport system substrate-binding protein
MIRAVAAAALAALVPASDPGVTSKTIVIGGTVPLSGPESAYAPIARGAQAYFDYVNARGGVYGRKIVYKVEDDAYDPARTVQATRDLVEQQKVLAIFNSVGTEHSLAVRAYLNQMKIPQLFVGSGATVIAREHARLPWTIGFLPSFAGEGAIYGRALAATRPRATYAVLYEDSDFGKDLVNGFKHGLGKRARNVVSRQTYEVTDTDVASQVSQLKASKADTLVLFALPKQTIQGFLTANKLGWHPHVVVTSVSIDPFVMNVVRESAGKRQTEGTISSAFLHDPTNPTQARSRGVKLYRQIMKRYLPNGDPKAVAHLYGMAAAYTMVDALEHAGRNPTRASLLRAAQHLNEANPFLLGGIRIRTSPRDYFPIATTHLVRYQGTGWKLVGKLLPVH